MHSGAEKPLKARNLHDLAESSSFGLKSRVACTIMQIASSSRRQAQEIGRRAREARTELGLRQDELAVAAGVSTRAVHQIEHGKPTSRLDVLSRVLDVLGLELQVADRRARVRGGGRGNER
jgi:HTH-type transcriptional regulator / antitoxin HipB